MIREIKLLLEDDEKIAIISTAFLSELADWEGPFDVRVVEDPYHEDQVEIELKTSGVKRVTT